jgi:CRISPR-associated protein Csd1
MSWLQRLYETYEACKGHEPAGEPLMPIGHTTQQAHIEVVLDNDGQFLRGAVIDKVDSTTLIPCTEESGGRAGRKPVNHPLSDKLQYIAGDYVQFGGEVTSGFAKDPDEPHRNYVLSLQNWVSSAHNHSKVEDVLRYVNKGRLVQDLIEHKILPIDTKSRKLLKTWDGDKSHTPSIFKVLAAGQSPDDSFVRWRVQDKHAVSATWHDETLIAAWIAYYASIQSHRGLCMVSGESTALALQHPAKLRNTGDKAKLISSNDITGYTFRGRFLDADEAVSVGFQITQKAHNALRWLIARQGARVADQAIVSWAVSGTDVPSIMDNTYASFGIEMPSMSTAGDVGQDFALRLNKAMAGYRAKLEPDESIVVMAFESATPGRLAIAYYRELMGSDFLHRIETWHRQFAWPQNFGKDTKFIGAPSPGDIAEAAFGRRVDEKLEMFTRRRLLPCIVDGAPFSRDLEQATFRRVINRIGMEKWEWEKCLGIACALVKGLNMKENYQMALEAERTTRDYLFGRLLAVAERIEWVALRVADEKRDTSAERLMQRFASRPSSTWRNLELALVPYKARLRSRRLPFLLSMNKLLDDIVNTFEGDDFIRDDALSSEFLLGYHCQRQALRPKTEEEDDAKEAINETAAS